MAKFGGSWWNLGFLVRNESWALPVTSFVFVKLRDSSHCHRFGEMAWITILQLTAQRNEDEGNSNQYFE